MSGPRSVDAHGEGTVFAIPLPDGELVVGIVIRRDHPRVVRIGLVLDPVRELPASPEYVSRSKLGILTQVRAEALDAGDWPVVGLMESFDPAAWPNPPLLPGDRADDGETAERLRRHVVGIVRHRRLQAMRDRTWLIENPDLADPIVGTRYMRLPPDRIRHYVEERLSHCGTLGTIVLERTNLAHGTFISTLPQEVGVEQAVVHPDAGGKLYDRGRNLIRGHLVHPDGRREPVHHDGLSVLTMVSEWLGTGSASLVVFRDWFSDAEPADRLARDVETYRTRGGLLLTHGAECYGVIPPGAMAAPVTRDFLDQLEWSKVGFLTRHEGALDGRRELIDADLVEMSGALEAIVIGAYDGEGYVVWTRTNGDRWLVG